MRLAFLLLSTCLLLAACTDTGAKLAPSEPRSGGVSQRVKIAMLPKKKGVPYFTSCADGAKKAADELGDVELVYDGPTDGSPEAAAAMIERWTLEGVDVIAVSPNDPNVVAPAMKAARDKGIHVITCDADAAPDTREFMVNQATAEQIGAGLVDAMAADLGGAHAQGEVAILTAAITATNQNQWMEAMKARLPTYPGLKLVAIEPTEENQKLAFSKAQDLMKAHPNLRGLFAISSVAFPGAAEAVKQGGKAGQVQVIGLATPNDMRAYVQEGVVKTVLLWNTEELGALTVRVGRALAKGELKPGATEFDAGPLGKKKVVGDQVLLGGLLLFTKDNIDQYHF